MFVRKEFLVVDGSFVALRLITFEKELLAIRRSIVDKLPIYLSGYCDTR